MKVVLTFDLEKDEDIHKYKTIIFSESTHCIVENFGSSLRNHFKHKELTEEQQQTLDEVWDLWSNEREILNIFDM